MSAHSCSCILYLGDDSAGSTSGHRVAALRRLGHEVIPVDPRSLFSSGSRVKQWLDYRTGYRLIQCKLLAALQCRILELSLCPTLIWVNSGELLGSEILAWLRLAFNCPLVLYCNDDPSGPRDWLRFASLRHALPLYDLCICCREVNELEWLALGASRVLRVWMSYDELIHYVNDSTCSPCLIVSFAGTNIPNEHRDRFLLALLRCGVPLSLQGSNWQRSPVWSHLKPCYSDQALRDRAYASYLRKHALSLGLLSHGNRDLHTRRSAEVPAAGGVLLAERSSEHQLLFEEGVEAFFWDSTDECASVAKKALVNPATLGSVRKAGHELVGAAGMGNEDICQHVLAML